MVKEFTALGVYFNNYDSLCDITDKNYTDKLEKANSRSGVPGIFLFMVE